MNPRIDEKTSISELGALVCDALRKAGIEAFLSGGAVVSIYTENKYQSYDLDFVTLAERRKVHEVMIRIGFDRTESRLYTHPGTMFSVEFPGAAFLIGDQPIREFAELKLPQGTLRLLTPTDCVKDRLAAYFHWNDRQGLNQAVAVAVAHPVNIGEIESWSEREGMRSRFGDFFDSWKEESMALRGRKTKKPSKVPPVKTHPLRIKPSKSHPDGVTRRHFHCAKNPSGKDELSPPEIEAIAKEHFRGLPGSLCPLSLKFPSGGKFDPFILGWVTYWNEVLKPKERLDANLIKALVASESGFDPESGAGKKGRSIARGLTQLTPQTVKALSNEKGELKDHYVVLAGKEVQDPNLNLCGGVRWLFQKQVTASHRLGREATWDEAVEEYKGVLKNRLAGKKTNPKLMEKFRGYLEALKKCGKA